MLRAIRGLESQLGNAAGAISDAFQKDSSGPKVFLHSLLYRKHTVWSLRSQNCIQVYHSCISGPYGSVTDVKCSLLVIRLMQAYEHEHA